MDGGSSKTTREKGWSPGRVVVRRGPRRQRRGHRSGLLRTYRLLVEGATCCADRYAGAAIRAPPQPGKETDSRARRFVARHGKLVQVELDALPPDVPRTLYTDAIAAFWNDDAYRQALAREATERRSLTKG